MTDENSVKPITPAEVAEAKKVFIPDDVFEVFNEEIAKSYSNGRAVVMQDKVVSALHKRGHLSRDLFENNYLDIEDVYRKAGWHVEYDKPAYNEVYSAKFIFRKPRVDTFGL